MLAQLALQFPFLLLERKPTLQVLLTPGTRTKLIEIHLQSVSKACRKRLYLPLPVKVPTWVVSHLYAYGW